MPFLDNLWALIARPLSLSLWGTAFLGFIIQLYLSNLCLRLKKSRARLSPVLQLNIFMWLMYGTAVFVWQCYLFVILDVMQRNVYALFFVGIFMTASGHTLSVSITFLMFERILIISRSNFHARHQNFIVRVGRLTCLCVFIFILVNTTVREMPLQPLTECQTFFCIMKNGSNFINSGMKTIIGAINVLFSISFILILYLYTCRGSKSSNSKFKTANLLVVFAIVSEITFVIFPRLIELSCTQWTWFICSTAYMGYAIQFNIMITGLIYLLILKPKGHKKNASIATVTVMPQSSFVRKE